jgi:mono/diheme cytochrome c family protein
MKFIKVTIFLVTFLVLAACDDNRFSLPQGNPENGKIVFIDLQCSGCHSLTGVDHNGAQRAVNVKLGGAKSRAYTYQELLTSIINPSHKLAPGYPRDQVSIQGKSKMQNYNDIMTVSELIDLVTFLESKYTLQPIRRTEFPIYVMPKGVEKL